MKSVVVLLVAVCFAMGSYGYFFPGAPGGMFYPGGFPYGVAGPYGAPYRNPYLFPGAPRSRAVSNNDDNDNNSDDSDDSDDDEASAAPIIADASTRCGREIRGNCRARSAGCEGGEFRTGFCPGTHVCCAPVNSGRTKPATTTNIIDGPIRPDSNTKCGTFALGQCRAKSQGCAGGEWRSGMCPGSDTCCAPLEKDLAIGSSEVVVSKGGKKDVKRFKRGGASIWYRGPMEADADGSLMAYHPRDQGIDFNKNGGWPGEGFGLAGRKDSKGRIIDPCIQKATDPCPGFYISATSIARSFQPNAICNANNWVNSDKIPYIVLPMGSSFLSATGASKGDLAVVIDLKDRKGVYSWVADMGPDEALGEAATATILAMGSSPFKEGKLRCGAHPSTLPNGEYRFLYIVFTGTRASSGFYDSYSALSAAASQAYQNWGGDKKLKAITGFDSVSWVQSIPEIKSLNVFTSSCGLPISRALASNGGTRWEGCRPVPA